MTANRWSRCRFARCSKTTRDRRVKALYGIAATFGLTEPLFVPKYWNPPSLFDLAQRTGFGIKSLIFCFARSRGRTPARAPGRCREDPVDARRELECTDLRKPEKRSELLVRLGALTTRPFAALRSVGALSEAEKIVKVRGEVIARRSLFVDPVDSRRRERHDLSPHHDPALTPRSFSFCFISDRQLTSDSSTGWSKCSR